MVVLFPNFITSAFFWARRICFSVIRQKADPSPLARVVMTIPWGTVRGPDFMNPLLIRPTILGLIGAFIVAARWFQLRRQVPRWTLAPAILCVIYVFFRAWAFRRASSAGDWYTFDNYIYYADVSYGFNPSLLANRWVERLHLFPLISVVYESLVLAIAATYAYLLGRRGLPIRVLALMVLTGLLGMQAYHLLPACGPVYLLGSACYLGEEPAKLRGHFCRRPASGARWIQPSHAMRYHRCTSRGRYWCIGCGATRAGIGLCSPICC